MNIREKAAYIKGLAEGLELDNTTKEGKLILALIDLAGDMAEELDNIAEDVDTALDYCEELDEDLGAVEEMLLEDECDCDCDEFDCDGDCENCDEDCELLEDEDDDFFEVQCPACGETICFDETVDLDAFVCPACGETFRCTIEDADKTDAQ